MSRKGGYVWHDLRHEYGSSLIGQCATIQKTNAMMRHADLRTTERYLKARDQRLLELSERLKRGYSKGALAPSAQPWLKRRRPR